jgi:H+-transporting ATPase
MWWTGGGRIADRQSKQLLEANEKLAKKKKGKSDDDDDEDDDGPNKGPSVCSVDQSAITGESLAVDKFLGDTAYYTCGVKRGKCFGVVICPAKESFVGRTASLVSSRT